MDLNVISGLLEKALGEKLENYEITKNAENDKGQGHLGKVVFVTVRNKNTGKDRHLAVKQVLKCDTEAITKVMSAPYINEIYFYNKVVPVIKEFLRSYPEVTVMESIPVCYATSLEPGLERLVFDNLKVQGYEIHSFAIPFKWDIYEAIANIYGQYHGVFYGLKNKESEKYSQLSQGFLDNFRGMIDQDVWADIFKYCCIRIQTFLKEENELELVQAFQKYVDHTKKYFVDAISYRSPYSVILHGDCWKNNFLFKYNNSGDMTSLKFVDFQMAGEGSPALDLSYTFYSDADDEILANLDKFLKTYHTSLGHTLKQMGLNIEQILPYAALEEEWKQTCAFGFLLGLKVFVTKCLKPENVRHIVEIMDGSAPRDILNKAILDTDSANFKKPVLSLLNHLYKNGFL
ncbi:uncharacterized protein LOC114331580 [Diabrotica virgifera virgifera]|uniref:Uncharacterized protein LOC114331580 n=1 Tax=Diabrotica virgifera virgifera TaxID=50390 RepID=A0A6P7FLS2_DIAVI|nr:uncharacterized protein LOC114331580 [Diabrotica virgifera virgifera]